MWILQRTTRRYTTLAPFPRASLLPLFTIQIAIMETLQPALELTATAPTTLALPPQSNLLSFFAQSRKASTTSLAPKLSTQSHTAKATDLPALSQRLPMPNSNLAGLTRSQSLFTLSTGIDARALSIDGNGGNEEFFLFMEMRAEKRWVSYNMNTHKWVPATIEYNSRLAELNAAKNIAPTIPKHPRALMEQLGDIETKISARIANNNFTCMFLFSLSAFSHTIMF